MFSLVLMLYGYVNVYFNYRLLIVFSSLSHFQHKKRKFVEFNHIILELYSLEELKQ